MFNRHPLQKWIALILLLLLIMPATAFAANQVSALPTPGSTLSGERVLVESGQTAKGPGFYSGTDVIIKDNIDGTVFASGQTVQVEGRINGDLFVAAQSVIITGEVSGNVFGAGQTVTFAGTTQDLFLAGQAVTIKENAKARDVFTAGSNVTSAADISRQLFMAGAQTSLGGKVGDDVYLAGDSIVLHDNTVIGGNFNYEAPAELTVPSGATIAGEQNWKQTTTNNNNTSTPEQEQRSVGSVFFNILMGVAGAFIVWLIIDLVRPQLWERPLRPLYDTPIKTLGIGLIALVAIIPLSVLMMITVVGLPAGILLLISGGVTAFLAKIFLAVVVAGLLVKHLRFPTLHRGIWLMLVSLLIVQALSELPYVGFVVVLAALLITFGSITLSLLSGPYRNTPVPPMQDMTTSSYKKAASDTPASNDVL